MIVRDRERAPQGITMPNPSFPNNPTIRLAANTLTFAEQDAANAGLLALWTIRRRQFDNSYAANVTVSQIKAALLKGAQVDSWDRDGYTSLMWAAWSGNLAALDALVLAGAKIEKVDYNRDTALIWAVRERNLDCARFLISAGAKVNAVGNGDRTPLMEAARNGDAACLDLLLDNKADVNALSINISCATALDFAAEAGSAYCMRQLISHGADVYDRGPCNLHPILIQSVLCRTARSAAHTGNTEALRYLISVIGEVTPTELDTAEMGGLTPLMVAAQRGHVDAVSYFVSIGANIKACDHLGRTALTRATDHPDIVAILKVAGAK